DEELPPTWRCAGTTGYESLTAVHGLFVDPGGHRQLVGAYAERTGADLRFSSTAESAKGEVLSTVLAAEVERLVDLAHRICETDIRLRDHSRRALHESIVELLVHIAPYRIYVDPGRTPPADDHAAALMADAV